MAASASIEEPGKNRWHVGIDLFANVGNEVVACEAGRIIALQYFYEASSGQRTYGILVEHAGCLVNYGEVTGDSLSRNNLREGDNVVAGQVIGFISDTGMLHVETYALREDHRYHNLQWWNIPETPNPPAGLLNPTQYFLHLQQYGLPVLTAAPTVTGATPAIQPQYHAEALINLIQPAEGEATFDELYAEDALPVSALTYDALREEYITLFTACVIRENRLAEVDRIIQQMTNHQARYEAAGQIVNISWFFIAVIHSLEASLRFGTHLHNGDPLTARTVHVPAGRPVSGTPPFTWEDSAADALTMHRLHSVTDWSICRMLFELERYNGWGYRRFHPAVKSPYLWSFSNQYTSGKYVADGKWSATAVSGQAGGAVILKRMVETNQISVTL